MAGQIWSKYCAKITCRSKCPNIFSFSKHEICYQIQVFLDTLNEKIEKIHHNKCKYVCPKYLKNILTGQYTTFSASWSWFTLQFLFQSIYIFRKNQKAVTLYSVMQSDRNTFYGNASSRNMKFMSSLELIYCGNPCFSVVHDLVVCLQSSVLCKHAR